MLVRVFRGRRRQHGKFLMCARRGRTAGTSVLELVATMTFTMLVAGAGAASMEAFSRSIGVEAARLRVLGALVEARRTAYASEGTVEAAIPTGAHQVTLSRAGQVLSVHTLPRGTSVVHANATGRVRFFASGFAENATFTVGADTDAADAAHDERSIVVNQRGTIR